MTGTDRRVCLAAILLTVAACSVPASEGPSVSSPASRGRPAPGTPADAPNPTAPPAPREGDARPPGATPGTPSSDKTWPFVPVPTADERKAQLERLAKDQGPLRSNWIPPGKTDRYGHAEAMIGAPYDVVKARLLDFAHYRDLAGSKFKRVNVVDKQGGFTDLYFQLPIMKGLVTLWYVTRFGAARPEGGGGEVIEGNFVKGNIKDMQIAFTLRPGPDSKSTVLACDINLAISVPAPQNLLDEELRDACGDALNAVRAQTKQP